MLVFIDDKAIAEFRFRTRSDEYGPARRYYCARAPRRAILVCRNGLDLADLRRKVVDGAVDWDEGWRDFVRPGNEKKRHQKIILFRVSTRAAETTLSALLAHAPRDET